MSGSNENQAVRERVIQSSSTAKANPNDGTNLTNHVYVAIDFSYSSADSKKAKSALSEIKDTLSKKANGENEEIAEATRRIMAEYDGKVIVADGGYGEIRKCGERIHLANIKIYDSVEAVLNDHRGRTDLEKIFAYQIGKERILSLDKIRKSVESAREVKPQPQEPTAAQTYGTMPHTTYANVSLEKRVMVKPGR